MKVPPTNQIAEENQNSFHALRRIIARSPQNQEYYLQVHGRCTSFSRDEQLQIGSIIGSLDDKIEMNRRTNETLEAIARALFKSWFVDFDPVRAKMEGRQPFGMDAETAALFPDSFEDSPIGKIPEGWKVGKIAQLASITRKGLNPGDFEEELFEYFSIPAFDEIRLPVVEKGIRIKSNKFIVPGNSVLISKLNPNIPRVWFPKISRSRRSVCSTEFLVLIPKEPPIREYLYDLFNSGSFYDVFSTLVTGTSGSHQRVKPEYLLDIDTLMPGYELICAFTNLIKPFHEKIWQNMEECSRLAAMRDLLLPKLLSGELRIPVEIES